MATTTQTALDLITDALREINSLAVGEVPDADIATNTMRTMNNMIDSWTIEKLFVFSSTENRFVFSPGTYQYTIGNPVGGTFTGTITGGSNQITGVTVPSGLVVGSMITDIAGVIPTSTPTQVTQIVGSTVTLSQNATANPAVSEVFTYTTPGNIAYDSSTGASISLPVRITNAFTRITVGGGNPMVQGLDYPIQIITRDKYAAIGLKGVPGPWPTALYYDRTYPLGNLYFYPNPSQGGELHYWTDTILSDFTTTSQAVNFPQGYARAIVTNLAIELAAQQGKNVPPSLAMRAKQSKAAIKALNAIPAVEAFFDAHILRSRRNDAGWIMNGGFNT